MIDLKRLEEEREEATIDKVDLFDFYNKNFNRLIREIRALRDVTIEMCDIGLSWAGGDTDDGRRLTQIKQALTEVDDA